MTKKKRISVLFCILVLVFAACQSKVILRSDTIVQTSNVPFLEITPSQTPTLSKPTHQVDLPRATRELPVESPRSTSRSNILLTPTLDERQQTPTNAPEETSMPIPTFDNMLASTVYIWSDKGPFSAFNFRGERLIRTMALNDDIYPNSPGRYPGVGHSLNLAFANNSPFVAYLRDLFSPKNMPRELWIADLSLRTYPKNSP